MQRLRTDTDRRPTRHGREGAGSAGRRRHRQRRLAPGAPADLVVHLAEYSEDHEQDGSTQFVGTLFEQGALVFFDCLVLAIQRTRGIDPNAMYGRHNNLE
ncbi:hypothetical protein ACLGIH_33175 [Streptomyces sp. HMX87]|uniref:hypothetical protein n=1 Tax=Streptomyces sp. HMX87 TaxID=3390849 RepID=UPI003A86B8DF